MFRRKEDGTEELISDAPESASPATPVVAPPASTAIPNPATPPVSSAQSFRPAPPQAAMTAPRPPSLATPPSMAAAAGPDTARTPAAPMSRAGAKRVLTVGPDIQMKGEITSCDRVVIEGAVDATMRDVHTVELSQTGTLKGTAEVEDAEISGTFEGDLLVRGKLTIQTTGRVRGNVTYGEIEIQRGGQISGNVRNAADAKNISLGKKAA